MKNNTIEHSKNISSVELKKSNHNKISITSGAVSAWISLFSLLISSGLALFIYNAYVNYSAEDDEQYIADIAREVMAEMPYYPYICQDEQSEESKKGLVSRHDEPDEGDDNFSKNL